ncbi:MAG: hypothetical protein WAN43_16070 [Rhodomicrobium sp.]
MIDHSARAFWRQAIDRVGVSILLARAIGYAPNVVTFSVNLKAKVALSQPDSSAPAQEGLGSSGAGAVTENDRTVVVMAEELFHSRFPLPVQKGDLVTLPETAEQFTVTRVDPYALAIAGAIRLTVTGVA